MPYSAVVGDHSEDGESMVLQNIGVLPQHYMVSQFRGPWLNWYMLTLKNSLPWKFTHIH